MRRPKDQIWIEGDRGRFDKFQRLELSTDVFGDAQCWFTVADDRAWRSLAPLLSPGREFRVYCNGILQFTGRAECNELPEGADEGSVIQVVLRTRLADARIGSADSSVRAADTSIKKFLLALYAKHGFVESDFVFAADTDRDLITGKKKGARDPIDLDALPADKAKVQPTETTYDCAKRHLERHHLMQWEGGDGRIVIGIPDDTQDPIYRFERRTGVCTYKSARALRDWAEVPGELWVYGGTGVGKDVLRAPFRGVAVDYDLAIEAAASGHFDRRVILAVEGAKDLGRANAQARRELAARSRRKAAWEVELYGWTFWDGARATPYAVNTTVDVDAERHEGTPLRGVFLVTGVRKSFGPDDGPMTSVTLLQKGLIDPVNANP